MEDPPVAIIAAHAENKVIGKGAEIPWKVKGEQKLFKDITMGGTLVMGRKTYDTIGRPLPGRTTIVVSRDSGLKREGCLIVHSLEEALSRARQLGQPVFVAGGGEIYRQAMDDADCLHLTTVHTTVEGDVLFPDFPADEFRLVEEKQFESNINYTYRRFERRQQHQEV